MSQAITIKFVFHVAETVDTAAFVLIGYLDRL